MSVRRTDSGVEGQQRAKVSPAALCSPQNGAEDMGTWDYRVFINQFCHLKN